jgi:hypothetical protein
MLAINNAPPDDVVLVSISASFDASRDDFETTWRGAPWQCVTSRDYDLARTAALDAEVAQLDDLERRLSAAVVP